MKVNKKNSKRGFSLAEAIVACLVLSLFALGVSSSIAFSTGLTAKAVQKADTVAAEKELMEVLIAALSSGSYTQTELQFDAQKQLCEESRIAMLKTVGYLEDDGKTVCEYWQGITVDIQTHCKNTTPVGFYITLTCNGEELNGYASNTGGAFYAE